MKRAGCQRKRAGGSTLLNRPADHHCTACDCRSYATNPDFSYPLCRTFSVVCVNYVELFRSEVNCGNWTLMASSVAVFVVPLDLLAGMFSKSLSKVPFMNVVIIVVWCNISMGTVKLIA